jgi:hypothetical protein
MTVGQSWPLLEAVKSRLEEALDGQGVVENTGDDPSPIPIFDDITEETHRLYVRLDNFAVLHGASSVGHADRHTFLVRVVHQNIGDKVTKPGQEISRIQALVVAALEDWAPFANAGNISHLRSGDAPETDPAIQSGVSRFKVMITGD